MFSKYAFVLALSCASVAVTPAIAGPEWVEQGDAGRDFITAQRTIGTGSLNSIVGALSTGFGVSDFEDMYLITIVDPVQFSMQIVSDFDAQLFLFNVTVPGELFGLLGNNDTAGGNQPMLGPISNDGTGAQVNLPGVYAIAISGFGRNPVSINGNIFNFVNPTEISGPDGPGGTNPLSDWSGEGAVGSYALHMTGVSFYDLPAPGGMALLAVAAGFLPRRRRA